MQVIIDFETYGATSLPDYGLHNYVNCPTFKVLCAHVIVITGYGGRKEYTLDFINNDHHHELLTQLLAPDEAVDGEGVLIIAHNAAFEKAVLKRLGFPVEKYDFLDTAHIARAMGANGSLANASRQLLTKDKYKAGEHLIKLFCIPGELQVQNESLEFDPAICTMHYADWADMVDNYCKIDTQLSEKLAEMHFNAAYKQVNVEDLEYWDLTQTINETGWHVDVEAVQAMKRQWEHNCTVLKAQYPDLNFNSHKQLKAYCKERGVNARSFDELNVKKMLDQVRKKLSASGTYNKPLQEVLAMLQVKQELAGSSLKKLDKILNNVGDDNRLRDQYVHFGAGQTGRTSGRTVQMQNLKRLRNPIDMSSIDTTQHDNATLAENIRQVFTAESPKGVILTGDLSAIESRGLSWLANEAWKIQAYRENRGVYEELAARMLKIVIGDVGLAERATGKLGELSCGYGAGPKAVKDFAERMGTILTDEEARNMVTDWRAACPKTVDLWHRLRDAMFHAVKHCTTSRVKVGPDSSLYHVSFEPHKTPDSLRKKSAVSIVMSMQLDHASGITTTIFNRVFHGVHLVGRDIRYFKPTSNKGGEAWSDTYINPKTKRREHHKLHGGKLTGILTQSMCREIFFSRLKAVNNRVSTNPSMRLVGQFHDEVNIEINPSPEDMAEEGELGYRHFIESTAYWLEEVLSFQSLFTGLPMAASVAYDYRYVK